MYTSFHHSTTCLVFPFHYHCTHSMTSNHLGHRTVNTSLRRTTSTTTGGINTYTATTGLTRTLAAKPS